jgi:hypothetical protein|tara:strand:+ start:3608 stop:4096 length:489 start_codon:yes stop_codon:yes gene_type:complete
MKIILSLVLLINLLGYLMMTNVPPPTPSTNKEYEQAGTEAAASLVLLSELSGEQLAALSLPPPQLPEHELVEAGSAQESGAAVCEMLRPFADEQLAAAALALLLPDLASQKGSILASPAGQYWLSIPTPETLGIPENSWHQLETKKRYLEDCIEVANRLKFH